MPDGSIGWSEVLEEVKSVNKAFDEYKKANDEAIDELKSKGSTDPVLEEKVSKIDEAISDMQERIDLFNARLRRQAKSSEEDDVDLDKKAFDWANSIAKRRGRAVEKYDHEDLLNYKAAFTKYMLEGERALDAEETKALSVGRDVDGGYVVYPDMSGRIVNRVFETSPVRQYASIQTIGTDALEGIHDVDEASSGWVGEVASRTETDTPELDVWRIPVHEQYAEPRATQKLLDDAALDMEAWLAAKVADKMARTENTAFVSGNGVTRPRGFTTYPDRASAETFEIGAIRQFDTGANGDFVADPNGGDILLDMVYGLKQAYRQNGVWFMARATLGRIRKLADSDGAYLWQPGIAAGQPSTLLGYPVATFEDMPAYTGTGNLAVAFGDLGAAYQIVDRQGIRVLTDPFTAKPYVKFYTTKRVGGDVVNFEALNLLAFTA